MDFAQFERFYAHQLTRLPQDLWRLLFDKLYGKISGAPSAKQSGLFKIENGKVVYHPSDNAPMKKYQDIWMIDHVLTFEHDQLLAELDKLSPSSLETLELILCSKQQLTEGYSRKQMVSAVWPVAQSYQTGLMNEEGQLVSKTTWYVKDEIASLLEHAESIDANMDMVVFFHFETQTSCTWMWPIQDIQPGSVLRRNYFQAMKESEKLVFKLCYFPEKYMKDDSFCGHFNSQVRHASTKTRLSFYKKNLISETCKEIKIFTTPDFMPLFQSSLEHSRFIVTSNIDEADIVWIGKAWTDWTGIHERNQFINQYPGENVLTVKDLLLKAIYRVFGVEESKSWYPLSFNLNTETELFVGEYLRRQNEVQDNIWIVKPWNGTRSEGIIISQNLSEILLQLSTGPKLVASYIHPPALLNGFKFDLRVIVIVDSIQPELKLFVFEDAIYPRVANRPYENNGDFDFQSHFTVMKYRNLSVKKVSGKETGRILSETYGKQWDLVLKDVYQVIRKAVLAAMVPTANSETDPYLGHFSHSKAIYGADILLDSHLNPYLLEFSMIPDTGRVLDQYPTFYADLFQFLFVQGGKEDPTLSKMFIPI